MQQSAADTRAAYRDFDHVGDEGTCHDTGHQAKYEVMHLPPTGPIYCIPHNEDAGWPKRG